MINMKVFATVAIFVIVYFFIATEKINKTIVAVVGASLMLALKLVTFDQAVDSVDFNVIFLLVGMMTSVSILSKTGFFEWAATSIAKKSRGEPVIIMISLLFITAIFSAVLDNVTTVILLVPVTILISQILEISPVPIVIMEVIASNVGGTSTLIGDPPNIIIGSKAGLTFNQFFIHLGPVIGIIMLWLAATSYILFKKRMRVPDDVKKRVLDAIPKLAIVDKRNMIKSLIVLGVMLVLFTLHSVIDLEPGIIALGGSMVLIMICKSKSDTALMSVEWGVIFFFIGLFMMISALEYNGVLEFLARAMLRVGGHNLFILCLIVLWGSALFSSVLDNIPFVITMVPMIKYFIPVLAKTMQVTEPAVIQATIAQPLWWSLALGACLGGNGTLIGASANVVAGRICEKNKYPISFMLYTKYGFALMIQTILICSVYIWFRYF
jgi:Na+/H+ antiporter NhaD/arsenite permease-like protein